MSASLSVIIPTHKRAVILRRCLECLEKQTIADRLEVIVVSDGHDPETAALLAPCHSERRRTMDTGHPTKTHVDPSSPLRVPRWYEDHVHFYEIKKSHQGVARNRGIEIATTSLVLFIGDDIFLAPDACEKHVKAHESDAVLGFTTWDPACGITPVMRWLEETGWQFGYPMIEEYAHAFLPREIQHRFTYTSHLSLPTDIARNYPFREDVTLYGWEDIEWGLRLQQAGIRLFYEPDAKALHHHHMTMVDSLKRMETLGRSAVTIEKLVSDLHVVPKGWKRIIYRIFSLLPTMRGEHANAFLRGIDRGA